MPDRPSIPAEVAREILLESGHRCAVCGTPCPLEQAHIIPWHKSREHKAEDLICLCANCHERADSEKWGEKMLREYKRMPWVLRWCEYAQGALQPRYQDLSPELKTAIRREVMELLPSAMMNLWAANSAPSSLSERGLPSEHD